MNEVEDRIAALKIIFGESINKIIDIEQRESTPTEHNGIERVREAINKLLDYKPEGK